MPNRITYTCIRCQQKLGVDESSAGHVMPCPKCSYRQLIVTPAEEHRFWQIAISGERWGPFARHELAGLVKTGKLKVKASSHVLRHLGTGSKLLRSNGLPKSLWKRPQGTARNVMYGSTSQSNFVATKFKHVRTVQLMFALSTFPPSLPYVFPAWVYSTNNGRKLSLAFWCLSLSFLAVVVCLVFGQFLLQFARRHCDDIDAFRDVNTFPVNHPRIPKSCQQSRSDISRMVTDLDQTATALNALKRTFNLQSIDSRWRLNKLCWKDYAFLQGKEEELDDRSKQIDRRKLELDDEAKRLYQTFRKLANAETTNSCRDAMSCFKDREWSASDTCRS